jgi:cell division protein ZapA (FtsZ GTPase activity inhibitor)
MDERLTVSGGGCSCGCCGEAVEMIDPAEEREQLLQMREQVDERLAELEESESA